MKRINVILISIILLNFSSIEAQNTTNDFVNLSLSINMDSTFYLGQNIPVTIKLKSKAKQDLYNLETAGIACILRRKLPFSTNYKNYSAFTGGNYYIDESPISDNVNEFVYIPKKRTIITLEKNKNIEKKLDLGQLFNKLSFEKGEYLLKITYEKNVTDSLKFRVILNYSICIPLIIDSLSSKNFETRKYYKILLGSLVGKNTDWEPADNESTEKVKTEVENVKLWWNEYKKLILLLETRLKERNADEKWKYKSVIPELIDNIEQGNYKERKTARDRLYYLLGINVWEPKVDDNPLVIRNEVDKLRNWWKENELMIRLINESLVPSEEGW